MFGFKYGFGFGYGVSSTYNPYIQYTWSTSVVNDYVTGPELVTNGTFDTGLDGWNTLNTVTWENGRAKLDTVGGAEYPKLSQYINTIGKTYLVEFDYETTGSFRLIGFNSTAYTFSGTGSFSNTLVASSLITLFEKHTSTSIGYIDNVSVKEVIQEPDVTYLRNTGTGGSTYNAEMFTGRALSFDSASSQSIDYLSGNYHTQFTSTDTTILWNGNIIVCHPYLNLWTKNTGIGYYDSTNTYVAVDFVFSTVKSYAIKTYSTYFELYENGVLVLTENTNGYLTGGDRSFGERYTSFLSGRLGNVVFYNGHLTQQQIADYHTTPHTFLYKTESGLASDSGLDTSKVVAWFPLTEDDGYVRDIANYSEGINEVTGTSWGLNSDDEIATLNSIDGSSFDLAVTTVGTNTLRPRTQISTSALSSTSIFAVKFNATINSGTPILERIYNGVTSIVSHSIKDGVNFICCGVIGNDSYSSLLLYFNGTNLFDVSISDFELVELSGIYPITNYTTDMPLKGLNYGLQTAKLLLDDNGVVVGKSDYLEGDGLSNYVDTGWKPSATESWTIECSGTLGTDSTGFLFGYNNSTSDRIRFVASGNNNYVSCFNGFSAIVSGYSGNTDIVLRFDALTNTVSLFMNKVLHTSSIVTPVFRDTSIYIMARHYNNTIATDFYNKTLTKFKVHNKALTDEEIQAL